MRRLALLIIAALLFPAIAEADPGRHGGHGDRGRSERMWSGPGGHGGGPGAGRWRDQRPRAERLDDRRGPSKARGGPGRGRDHGLPPGQAKGQRDGKPMPPGHAKRWEREQGRFVRVPKRSSGGYGRGHILPQGYNAIPRSDYPRYRLRRPPPGYSYYQRGRNAYLVSEATGMIFEVVPLL